MDLIEGFLDDKDFTFFPEELANENGAVCLEGEFITESILEEEVRVLRRRIITICMHCKEIRDDKGYWNQLEKNSLLNILKLKFSHGICPDCMKKFYPEFYEECV
jgi:hypothetical protein